MRLADKAVITVLVFTAGFLLGLIAGEEKAAVALKPCPVEAGMKIVSRTADVCTYVQTYKQQGKWEKKL